MKSWVVSLFRSVCVALTTVSIVFAGVPAQAFGMPLNNEVAESGSTSGQGGAGSLEEAANEQGSSGSTDGKTKRSSRFAFAVTTVDLKHKISFLSDF